MASFWCWCCTRQRFVSASRHSETRLASRACSPPPKPPGTELQNKTPTHLIITTPPPPIKMADRELNELLRKLKSSKGSDYQTTTSLLSRAKILLLKSNALIPTPTTPKPLLLAARDVFETGALLSIRHKDPNAFTRYVNQLTPFYELPSNILPADKSEQAKITGLYLLLLLTKGDYSGFHMELERLMVTGGDVEGDRYLSYPVKLERWLMEGSYDQVWKAMKSREVPSEEYGIFSEVGLSSPQSFYNRYATLA
jgi:26S proteasome regulatory subunit N12